MKLDSELSSASSTPAVKKGFHKLSSEEDAKLENFFTNKKRKRSLSDSEGDKLSKHDVTIFSSKNGYNAGCDGRSRKNKFGKSPKKDSNIYDINNFVVQNFSSKIVPKKEIFKIPTPIFQDLPEDYYLKGLKRSAKTACKRESKNGFGFRNGFRGKAKENHKTTNGEWVSASKDLELKENNQKQVKSEGVFDLDNAIVSLFDI